MSASEPPGDQRATLLALRRLLPYLRPHRAALLGSAVTALLASVAGLVIPLVVRAVVDGPVTRGDPATLPWLALAVLGLGLLEAGLVYTRRRLAAGPGNRVEVAMRKDLFAHLQRLPMAFHDRWPSGQLLSRLSSDLTTVRWFVAFSGIFLVVNVVTVVIGVGVLAWLSPWLGLAVAVMAVPLTVITLTLERRYSAVARHAQDQAGDLATLVEESVQGIRVLRSLGRGRHVTRRYLVAARGLRGTELAKVKIVALLWTALVVLPELAITAVLGLGAYGVSRGSTSIGTLVAAVSVIAYLYWPIASLGWLLAEASTTAAVLIRFGEVRDSAPSIVDPPVPVPLPVAAVRGELVFRGVRFAYPGADREILRGVDLTVAPGETVALVGATGSGKTTLTALVGRLYDVTGGQILLDGVDVRDLALADLRRAVATAFEDPVLISASVRENVALGAAGRAAGPVGRDEEPADAPDEVLWEALRVASADGFVAALPWGLDTRIGEQGLSLSGGQRQRLALARAVIGRPPVLVLDDPLSALDVATEAEVETALRRLLGPRDASSGHAARRPGVTALVVAHRPSTVALADRVAVLRDGVIAAVGTHRELLATDPGYRALLASPEGVRT